MIEESPIFWLLMSALLLAISGVPGLLLGRRAALGQWIAMMLNVVASGIGLFAVGQLLLHGSSDEINFDWSLPLGRFAISADNLAIVFLIPIFLVSALGSIYGLGYWPQRRHPGNGRQLRFSWGLMMAAMVLVLLARDAVLFLMAWEIIGLSAFFLAVAEDRKPQVRRAAWVYFVATHLGGLCLIGFFALLHAITGSFDLWNSVATSEKMTVGLFLLAIIGFGLKAGIMPFHVWLPGAHANAPSHVSAMLSGLLLNSGIYGLMRFTGMLATPPAWCGAILLALGAVSAVLGISYAAGQRDLKRLLAYSSIENMGIIVMGIGLATMGRSQHHTDWIVLGLGAALLHVLNHSLFKPLLFMGAGSVLHATGTRDMDLLGGLAKTMPRTFLLLIIAAIAICGLPPLNGFVSELFLYIGLFRAAAFGSGNAGWAALAAPALAIVGAMAVASFVKLLGIVFAGSPRTQRARHAHDPKFSMLAPMSILAACCIAIGVFPIALIGLLDRATAVWAPDAPDPIITIANLVPLRHLTAAALLLITAAILCAMILARLRFGKPFAQAGTWGCGYLRPAPRMQYTASSFSQMLVDLMAWVLWPVKKQPRIEQALAAPSDFTSDVPDVVLDRALLPGLSVSERILNFARIFQRGPIQIYLVYIFGILLVLFLIA